MNRMLFAVRYVKRGEKKGDGMLEVYVHVICTSANDGARKARIWAKKKCRGLGRIIETERLRVLYFEYGK